MSLYSTECTGCLRILCCSYEILHIWQLVYEDQRIIRVSQSCSPLGIFGEFKSLNTRVTTMSSESGRFRIYPEFNKSTLDLVPSLNVMIGKSKANLHIVGTQNSMAVQRTNKASRHFNDLLASFDWCPGVMTYQLLQPRNVSRTKGSMGTSQKDRSTFKKP